MPARRDPVVDEHALDDAAPTRRRLPNAASPDALPVPINIRSLALLVLAALATIYMVREMREVLIPIALSFLVFHSLAPFVERLVRWRLPRVLAAVAGDERS